MKKGYYEDIIIIKIIPFGVILVIIIYIYYIYDTFLG